VVGDHAPGPRATQARIGCRDRLVGDSAPVVHLSRRQSLAVGVGLRRICHLHTVCMAAPDALPVRSCLHRQVVGVLPFEDGQCPRGFLRPPGPDPRPAALACVRGVESELGVPLGFLGEPIGTVLAPPRACLGVEPFYCPAYAFR